MKIYDISLTMSPGMPVWPGDPPVGLSRVTSMDEGAHVNLTHLACSAHTGTHVDAPHHFLNDGRTVEALSLEVLTGPAHLVRIPDAVPLITATVLAAAAIPATTERLLLRTANSALWDQASEFFPEFVGISDDGADWLVRSGIRLIGVDYLSVAPYKQGTPTHRSLLEGGVVIVEGLDLRAVDPGEYMLYCLPLKLAGSDGAPARAILVA